MMKKKQILVAALLTGMLLPESIFSAETKGIENNTGKTNEMDYENVDILEVQAHDFSVEEIMNAYFGEDGWNASQLTQQSYGEKQNNWYIESEYSDENVAISCMCDDFGFFNFEVEYKNSKDNNRNKDEAVTTEKMVEEWLSMIDKLNLSVEDQYEKRTDEVNNKVQYVYRIKQNNLVIGDEIIIIGSAGNETDYPAPMLKVTIDENGYAVMASFLTDIVQADPATKRQIQSEENAKENFIEYMKELYSEIWNEIELQEDTFEAQLVYIPVDQGKRKTSYYKNIIKREN